MTASFHRSRGANARARRTDHRPPRRGRAALVALLEPAPARRRRGRRLRQGRGRHGQAARQGRRRAEPDPDPSRPAFSVAPGPHPRLRRDRLHPGRDGERRQQRLPGRHRPDRWGGTITINGTTITVPCNMIVQMPANTLTWADVVGTAALRRSRSRAAAYPSFEMRVVGNIVDGKHIAGLMFASQQSANAGSGDDQPHRLRHRRDPRRHRRPDAARRSSRSTTRTAASAAPQSPDSRFSVDDQNPTIHAGTGYPLCVPRTDPATADDPLCPQANRPKPAGAGRHCRNFTDAGVVPLPAQRRAHASRAPARSTARCGSCRASRPARPTDPDPRQQAPFEVGDQIT